MTEVQLFLDRNQLCQYLLLYVCLNYNLVMCTNFHTLGLNPGPICCSTDLFVYSIKYHPDLTLHWL